MSQPATESLLGPFLAAGKIDHPERYKTFERLSEIFTWTAVVIGLLVLQLPFAQDLNKPLIYKLAAGVISFVIVWYHLLPKNFSGLTKRFVYTVITVFFIFFLVHNTGGTQSYTVFFYFLTALSAAMSMPLLYTLTIFLLIAGLLFLEAFLTAGFLATDLSLAALHSWSLFLITFYARAEAGEAAVAKKRGEEIKLEKEKEVSRLKDQFVFIASHELKLPITTIKGLIDDILSNYSEKIGSEGRELLEQVELNNNRLTKLLGDLQNISQIEQGSLKVNLTDISLAPVVSDVLSNLFLEARSRRISILQRGDLDIGVKADADRLKEVLTNLVSNAIKYTLEGGQVMVEVKNEGDFARISVVDNGVGIKEEDQKHLFEKFYRIENEQTKAVKGSGLGLFITKQLVEKMGGEIGVKSAPGLGSTFYFTLPRYRW